MAKRKLTVAKKAYAARRAKFIEAYITNGGNASDAAIAAGYSKATARNLGYRLTVQPEVAAEIKRRREIVLAKAEANTSVSVERTLRELGRIVHSDPRRFFDENGNLKGVRDLDDDCAAGLASLEVYEEYAGRGDDREAIGQTKKIKFWDKNAAIEKAMKHLGLFEKDNSQQPPMATPIFNIIGVPGRR